MQKITTMLWFDGNAEEAVDFYLSVFPNAKKKTVTRWGDTGPGPKGGVLTIAFELEGMELTALNGGPEFKFNEAVSFVINCESQQEVDHYWEKLTAGGGSPIECGWLKDKFGLAWQVTPTILPKLIADPDRAKADRVMKAMMTMKKIVIADLEKAAAEPS